MGKKVIFVTNYNLFKLTTMDFKDAIKQLSDRVVKLRDSINTEEATKNALIMPFINALGYDVFNPLEVVPEMVCDIGTKKGEKIDYAIMKDGEPIILIECKHWKQDLNLHDNQLLRYFHVSKAKFGVLTNGIIYRFYTDLIESNKMDEKPFLEFDITDIKDIHVEELKKFHKSYFNIENILSSASELKFTSELKILLSQEFANPTPEFTKYFAKQVYDGSITAKLLEQFIVLTKKSIQNYINDLISERLKSAMKTESEEVPSNEQTNVVEGTIEKDVETTAEELESFMIIRAILRPYVDFSKIVHRDAKSYFAVLFDNNNRKPICRLYLNGGKKYIAFVNEEKKEDKYLLNSIDDIYDYSEKLIQVLNSYLKGE